MTTNNWMVLSAAIMMATTAQAQTVGDPDEFVADEITVFGGARDARGLLETPNAVTVFDQEEIRRRQASTYEELIGDIPGVQIDGGPRGISQEPNVRGFQDEQVVVRIDGARQNFNLAHRGRFFTDPDALKRVEVVRGGNSILFGSGALGGVILLETIDAEDVVDPGQFVGGRIKGGYSSQGQEFIGSGTVGVQYGDFDALGFISYRPMGEDLEDGSGNPISNSDIDAVNGIVKLGYAPGDHRFEVSYNFYDDEGVTPPNANVAGDSTNVVNRELSYQTLRGEWTWQPEDNPLFDVSALFYHNDAEVTEDRIFDGRLNETEYTTLGFELVNRSDFDIGVPVRLSYGIEGFQDEQEALSDGAPRLSTPDATARYFAAFAQGDIELPYGFTLTPGLRFDSFDVEPDGNFPDLSDSEVSPKLALQWRPLDVLQLWINASQSFRAPSITELYSSGTHFGFVVPAANPFAPTQIFDNRFVPTPDLEPERSRALEIGGRWSENDLVWQGDSINFSASAYYADVENFIDTIVTDFGPPTFDFATNTLTFLGSTFSRNVDAKLWGFEAALDYDADDWFFGAGLTLPRGTDGNGGNLGSIPQDRLVFTGGVRPLDGLELGARATFLDGQDKVPADALTTDGTAIFDLFGSYSPDFGGFDGATIRFGIDNLTDRTYRLAGNGLNQAGRAYKMSASIDF
ncbi:MAG: TonB-dependent hemoglobin/transferrin/lactoferrin family receptor [Pseudomonadota bacterium]